MRYIYLLLIVLFASVIVLFALSNTDSVRIAFLEWSLRLPVVALVILAYVLGMFTGGLLLALLRRLVRGARRRPG